MDGEYRMHPQRPHQQSGVRGSDEAGGDERIYPLVGLPLTASMPDLDGFYTALGPQYTTTHAAFAAPYLTGAESTQTQHHAVGGSFSLPHECTSVVDDSWATGLGGLPLGASTDAAADAEAAAVTGPAGQAPSYLASLPQDQEFRQQSQPSLRHPIVPFIDYSWHEPQSIVCASPPGHVFQDLQTVDGNVLNAPFDNLDNDINIEWTTLGASRFRQGFADVSAQQSDRPIQRDSKPDISTKSVAKARRPTKGRNVEPLDTKPSAPRRRGPLTQAQRDKADDTRYYGACWRCRRYKKPCNGTAGICETCSTSGFRVWPSSLGCRRGDLEGFVRVVVPKNAEEMWKDVVFNHDRPTRSWRTRMGFIPNAISIPASHYKDRWDELSLRIQPTRLFGIELIELIGIAARYQRQRDKEDPMLNAACLALTAACDFYHMFVATDFPAKNANVLEILAILRASLSNMWRLFLNACLTGRRASWVPAFISTCINACVLIVLMDGVVAVPEAQRNMVWPNLMSVIMDMRLNAYAVNLDLLNILSKGAKPLAFNCWTSEETRDPQGFAILERNAEGLKLVGGDTAAFDGMSALQQWLQKYGSLMKDGKLLLESTPGMQADIIPISVIFRFVAAATGSSGS